VEGLDQGLLVMLEVKEEKEVARLMGRKGSRRLLHRGEKMCQVLEQVLASSGSKESWWHRQKLKVGADQGWQVSPQRKEVCVGVAVDNDLVGLCEVPQSCTTVSQIHCQTRFCTGAVAVIELFPLPCC